MLLPTSICTDRRPGRIDRRFEDESHLPNCVIGVVNGLFVTILINNLGTISVGNTGPVETGVSSTGHYVRQKGVWSGADKARIQA